MLGKAAQQFATVHRTSPNQDAAPPSPPGGPDVITIFVSRMENLVGFAFGGNCWRDCRDLALKYKKKKKKKKGNGLEAKMQHKPPVLFTLMVVFFSLRAGKTHHSLQQQSLTIIHHETLLSHDKPALPKARWCAPGRGVQVHKTLLHVNCVSSESCWCGDEAELWVRANLSRALVPSSGNTSGL